VSDSARPHRRQPTRPPHPWDSPGKNTGVGCHFLLQCIKVKSDNEVAHSCLTQRPHGLQPTRLLRPWDFPGKSGMPLPSPKQKLDRYINVIQNSLYGIPCYQKQRKTLYNDKSQSTKKLWLL